MEANQLIAALGAGFMFCVGVITVGIRGHLTRLDDTQRDIYNRLSSLERTLSGLKSAHDTVMSRGAHRRDADHEQL